MAAGHNQIVQTPFSAPLGAAREETPAARAGETKGILRRVVIGLILLSPLAFWGVWQLWRAHAIGQLTACQSNLHTLGVMAWDWARTNQGRFPADLGVLVQAGQLRAVPTCPSAGTVTYAYQRARDGKNFTLTCRGDNHRRVVGWDHPQPGWPATTSRAGLTAPVLEDAHADPSISPAPPD